MPAKYSRRQLDNDVHCQTSNHRLVDRWKLVQLLKDIHKEIGIGERELAVLIAHISVLPKGHINLSGLNVSFMEVGQILERANCMDERRFRRGEVRLEQIGLISRNLSANGRRFPLRQNGKILSAYGIDLNPLLQRIPELEEIRTKMIERNEIRTALCSRISSAIQEHIRSLSDASETTISKVREVAQDVRKRLKRKTTSLSELHALEERVRKLCATVPPCPTRTTSDHVQSDLVSHDVIHEECEMFTAVNNDNFPDKTAVDGGQSVRHIESQRKEYKLKDDRTLSGFTQQASLKHVWSEAEALSEFYPEVPANEYQMMKVLHDISSYMQIRQETVLKGLSVFGINGLILCLDYLTKKISDIGAPGRYLQSMIKCYEEGQPVAGGRLRVTRKRDLISSCLAG